MSSNPYRLPQHLLSTSPLVWEAFRYRARPSSGHRSTDADLAGLLRLAIEGVFPLDLSHDGLSLLGASLSGWHGFPHPPLDEKVGHLPVPGEPASALLGPGVLWPEAIAGALIHRGADPFVGFDRLLSGEEVPVLSRSFQDPGSAQCPVTLALENRFDTTLAQMLRHPKAPEASQWDRLRVDGAPWLHVALVHRPRLLAPLLAHGLNPNAADSQGCTPLFRATTPEQVAALLRAGSDPSLTNPQGRLASDVWQESGLRHRAAMMAELKGAGLIVPSRVKPTNSLVFDEVMRGVRGRVAKAPAALPSPIRVFGFDQPVSLASHALMGVLMGTVTHPQPLLEAIWPRTKVGTIERALLSLAAFIHPLNTESPRGYESQSARQKREQRSSVAQWFQDTVRATGKATEEDMAAMLPQLVAFMADREPDLKGIRNLSTCMMRHLGQNLRAGNPMSADQKTYGPAIWGMVDDIGQRLPLTPGQDSWDPWSSFYYSHQGPSALFTAEPDIGDDMLGVLHRLGAAQRHLTYVPENATHFQWGFLIEKVMAWNPEQWQDLIQTGLADRFEDRMRACARDLPWAYAWHAGRRKSRAQSEPLEITDRSPRPRFRP